MGAAGRRGFLLTLASAVVLAGCGQSRLGRVLGSIEDLGGGDVDIVAEVERVRALPYASVVGKFGRGPQSVLVLGVARGDELSWFSADNAIVVTRGGRLVKTAGLPFNLRKTVFVEDDPLRRAPEALDGETWRRLVDIDRGDWFGLVVQGRMRVRGVEDIEIFGTRHTVLRVDEQCRARDADWTFTNTFWIDPDSGQIWRSRQHVDPETPPLEMWVLKPAHAPRGQT